MKRYNLTVKILANVSVGATSPEVAKRAILEELKRMIQLVDKPEYVVEDAEVTGIFDKDWNEIDETK